MSVRLQKIERVEEVQRIVVRGKTVRVAAREDVLPEDVVINDAKAYAYFLRTKEDHTGPPTERVKSLLTSTGLLS